MEKAVGRILKGNNTKFEGRICLGAASAAEQALPKNKSAASAAPQVRIVENHNEFAVIEIICSCGTITHLRCEYAADESENQPTDQTK